MPPLMDPREEAFCQAYAGTEGMKAAPAALAAGYSEGGVRKQAHILIRRQRVRDRISELLEQRVRRHGIDPDYILHRLFEEAEADVADLYENGQLKPVHEWPPIWRKGLVAGIDTAVTNDGVAIIKVKLSDRIKRLELLGRHVSVQAWRDKVSHENPDGSPLAATIDASKLSADTLRELMNAKPDEPDAE